MRTSGCRERHSDVSDCSAKKAYSNREPPRRLRSLQSVRGRPGCATPAAKGASGGQGTRDDRARCMEASPLALRGCAGCHRLGMCVKIKCTCSVAAPHL